MSRRGGHTLRVGTIRLPTLSLARLWLREGVCSLRVGTIGLPTFPPAQLWPQEGVVSLTPTFLFACAVQWAWPSGEVPLRGHWSREVKTTMGWVHCCAAGLHPCSAGCADTRRSRKRFKEPLGAFITSGPAAQEPRGACILRACRSTACAAHRPSSTKKEPCSLE